MTKTKQISLVSFKTESWRVAIGSAKRASLKLCPAAVIKNGK